VLPHQNGRRAADTKATIEYIAWMLKHSAEWAAGGHIPAYQPHVGRHLARGQHAVRR
jgi:multiple sugar transport system substrate-binding protein